MDSTGKEDVKDFIFSSTELTKKIDEFWVDEDLGSDHKSIFATFSVSGFTFTPPVKTVKLYHNADWQTINNNITNHMSQFHLFDVTTKRSRQSHK